MKDINKWFADKCDVELYSSKHINECGDYFYFQGAENDYEWSIQDPRCREIIRERFKINTLYSETSVMAFSFNIGDDKYISALGKTIADTEIACLKAIYEKETT